MKQKNTRWIALWLILASVALLITGTFAAFTRAEYIKRVVASRNESIGFLFSSNYLYAREASSSEFPLRMIPVSTQTDIGITITVCNYLQNDLTRVNDQTISYTFTAQLVNANGEELSNEKLTQYAGIISISGTPMNAQGFYTKNATLNGGSATTHFYEITCSKDNVKHLSDLCIQISAVPDGSSQEKLVALLSLTSGSRSDTPWSGKLVEVTSDTQDTTTLDAFNYVISGTSKTTVRISWNPEFVTLSPWSLALFNDAQITSAEDGKKYIDIRVGEDGTNYMLQFYRVNGIPEPETGEQVKGYVSFEEITDALDNTLNGGG